VVEDDPAWQEIFSEVIHDAGHQLFLAATYKQALAALANQRFALAILDVSLSAQFADNRDGLALLKKIAGLPEKLPAIIVTGYATVDLAVETLAELNAVNFFDKSAFKLDKFREAVAKEALPAQNQAGRSAHIPPGFLEKLNELVAAQLSLRELEVLYYLSQGQTNKEIAKALTVSVNTVKKHAQSIFTKLNVNSRAAAVAQALDRAHN
jgi:DNA-binding NarL/FixJ family response regulator